MYNPPEGIETKVIPGPFAQVRLSPMATVRPTSPKKAEALKKTVEQREIDNRLWQLKQKLWSERWDAIYAAARMKRNG